MTDKYDLVAELRARHANVTGNDPRITQPIVGPTVFLEAADEIERLRGMLEVQNEMVKHYVQERDSIRRTYCFIIASGNFNARDGNTAFKGEAEYVAELNRWDCFKDKT